jgi:hypothetical protein
MKDVIVRVDCIYLVLYEISGIRNIYISRFRAKFGKRTYISIRVKVPVILYGLYKGRILGRCCLLRVLY